MGLRAIGTTFRGNSVITSFNELKYFTNMNLPVLSGDSYFQSCTGLLSITLPCPLDATLPRAMLAGCTKLKTAIIMEGVTIINGTFFGRDTSLKYIELPSTLSVFGAYSGSTYAHFIYVPNSCSVILKAVTPPSAVNGVFTNFSGKFYVLDDSVAAYKAATGWSSIAARIFPISEYEGN